MRFTNVGVYTGVLSENVLEFCERNFVYKVKNQTARNLLPLAEHLDEIAGMNMHKRGAEYINWLVREIDPNHVEVCIGAGCECMGCTVVRIKDHGMQVTVDGQRWCTPDNYDIAGAILTALF